MKDCLFSCYSLSDEEAKCAGGDEFETDEDEFKTDEDDFETSGDEYKTNENYFEA